MALKDRVRRSRPASKDVTKLREHLRQGKLTPHYYVGLLGLRSFDTARLVDRIQEGLAYAALERFQKNVSLSSADVSALLQIPARTLSRRKDVGRLMPDESDRLVRAARVFGKAFELFEGDLEGARAWLFTANRALGGAAPVELAATDVGTREVEDLIDRLEHGVVA